MVLHNSLIFAILYKASQPAVPEVASVPVQGPPKKKRKLLPHQDPPPRLSTWILGMGKAERDRVRTANAMQPGPPVAPTYLDELTTERPIRVVAEGNCES